PPRRESHVESGDTGLDLATRTRQGDDLRARTTGNYRIAVQQPPPPQCDTPVVDEPSSLPRPGHTEQRAERYRECREDGPPAGQKQHQQGEDRRVLERHG